MPRDGFFGKSHVVIANIAVAVVNVAAGVDGNMIYIFFFFVCLLINTAIDMFMLRQSIHWDINIIGSIAGVIFFSVMHRLARK